MQRRHRGAAPSLWLFLQLLPNHCLPSIRGMQAAQVRAAQSFVESVFDGSFNNGTYPPLSATLPGVTLEALKHTLALVSLQGCSGRPAEPSRRLPPSTGHALIYRRSRLGPLARMRMRTFHLRARICSLWWTS